MSNQSKEHQETAELTSRQQTELVLNSIEVQYAIEYPAPTNVCLSLLSLLGYEADKVKIDRYFKAGQVTKPARLKGNRLAFDRERIVLLAELFEADRQWRPRSRHDSKKFETELEADRIDERNIAESIRRWMLADISEIVNDMIGSESFSQRQTAGGVLLHRLQLHGHD